MTQTKGTRCDMRETPDYGPHHGELRHCPDRECARVFCEAHYLAQLRKGVHNASWADWRRVS